MDARNRSLDDWFARIRTGQVRLPRFQRFEAWGHREVADLLQTVVDELPAGAVLVLEIGDGSPFVHRPLAGAPEPTERITELLLDGQQRLTALWRSLTEDYPDRSFFIDTRDVDPTKMVAGTSASSRRGAGGETTRATQSGVTTRSRFTLEN